MRAQFNQTGSSGYHLILHPNLLSPAFPPWFMRTSPNNLSEPAQKASTNVGRYTGWVR